MFNSSSSLITGAGQFLPKADGADSLRGVNTELISETVEFKQACFLGGEGRWWWVLWRLHRHLFVRLS